MNFQNFNFDHVEAPSHWPPQFQTSETSPRDSESTVQQQPRRQHRRNRHQPAGLENDSSGHSDSPQPTVVPPAPSPPTPSESTPEIYGPDRYQAGPPRVDSRPYYRHPDPPQSQNTAPQRGPKVRFDEAQLVMMAMQNTNTNGLKDELAIAAGKVTPGVDDGPYIQYAIEALTRMRHNDDDVSDGLSDGDFEDEMEGVPPPPPRTMEDDEIGYPPLPQPQASYAGHRDLRRERSSGSRSRSPSQQQEQEDHLLEDDEFQTLSSVSSQVHTPVRTQTHQQLPPRQQQHNANTTRPRTSGRGDRELWVPVTKEMRDNNYPNDVSYPPLTFKPRILRPFSLIIFMILCILMIVGLVFSAVYSNRHDGLTPYPNSIYSGQYFLFRLLPQLLAAGILVFAQAVVSTSLRVLPFSALASEDARDRYLALFQRLYPSTFLFPVLAGPWQFKAFSIATWLALFTVPLQSSVFTCILVNDKWIWATTQGVAWALAAFYLLLTIATGILMIFWFGKWTGLMWDVGSIGDLLPLLNRSNTTQGYRGADIAESEDMLKGILHERWFDRLGYWRMEDTQAGGIWYSIGASGTPSDQDPRIVHQLMGKRASHDPSVTEHDHAATSNMPQSRCSYLPWCLQDMPLIAFTATAGVLLLILLIVSFLPQTQLQDGFRPLLAARPSKSGFSSANFLYSFLPSLLGMVLFLLFQSLDQALRIVQPWGELSQADGGGARKSILADYATCSHPLEAAFRAARVGHWRVAVVSFFAALSIGIPVLGGGLFMALTVHPSHQVRMLPNIPVYGVLLALLFLYVGALTVILPRRNHLRLPHGVTTLAGVISLCSAEELTHDAAFRSVRSHGDLEARLGVDKTADPREETQWFFGVSSGKDEKRLSIRRLRRFTEKSTMRRSYIRSLGTRSMV